MNTHDLHQSILRAASRDKTIVTEADRRALFRILKTGVPYTSVDGADWRRLGDGLTMKCWSRTDDEGVVTLWTRWEVIQQTDLGTMWDEIGLPMEAA